VPDPVRTLDQWLAQSVGDVRWAPLTVVFVLLSAWWVKSLVFVGAALVRDLRERVAPWTALAVAAAFGLSSAASSALKELVDRPRPSVDPLVTLPSSASFPSGHATTAFAAAVAVAVLVPRLRAPALALATLVALSRVYLGVHYAVDIVGGALLGSAVGLAVAVPVARRRAAVSSPP
jgi:undecaprenyl-diphosphatase